MKMIIVAILVLLNISNVSARTERRTCSQLHQEFRKIEQQIIAINSFFADHFSDIAWIAKNQNLFDANGRARIELALIRLSEKTIGTDRQSLGYGESFQRIKSNVNLSPDFKRAIEVEITVSAKSGYEIDVCLKLQRNQVMKSFKILPESYSIFTPLIITEKCVRIEFGKDFAVHELTKSPETFLFEHFLNSEKVDDEKLNTCLNYEKTLKAIQYVNQNPTRSKEI